MIAKSTTKITKISTPRKLPAIQYKVVVLFVKIFTIKILQSPANCKESLRKNIFANAVKVVFMQSLTQDKNQYDKNFGTGKLSMDEADDSGFFSTLKGM